jgi:hypothetical protein
MRVPMSPKKQAELIEKFKKFTRPQQDLMLKALRELEEKGMRSSEPPIRTSSEDEWRKRHRVISALFPFGNASLQFACQLSARQPRDFSCIVYTDRVYTTHGNEAHHVSGKRRR